MVMLNYDMSAAASKKAKAKARIKDGAGLELAGPGTGWDAQVAACFAQENVARGNASRVASVVRTPVQVSVGAQKLLLGGCAISAGKCLSLKVVTNRPTDRHWGRWELRSLPACGTCRVPASYRNMGLGIAIGAWAVEAGWRVEQAACPPAQYTVHSTQ